MESKWRLGRKKINKKEKTPGMSIMSQTLIYSSVLIHYIPILFKSILYSSCCILLVYVDIQYITVQMFGIGKINVFERSLL